MFEYRVQKPLLPLLATLLALFICSLAVYADSFQVSNPLILQRADPQIYKHTDGYYYYTATVPEYDRIILRRATTIEGLSDAPEETIWVKHESGEMAAHIWAPEMHYIDGKWYIYFAAGSSSDIWRIRMYVLENASADPFSPTWVEKGQLVTNWDSFSLDATTFEHNGTRYLVWAQSEPAIDSNSNLYIAEMGSPWTILGSQVRIAVPTYAWETQGHKVNEGPAVLIRNGRVFITYSASATDANYNLGLLTASATSDLLDPASWTKSPNPIFQSNVMNSVYGPGHNQFTVSPDGTVDVLVYHGRDYREISGEPLYNPDRHTRVQQLFWNSDGTPKLGIPAANGTYTFGTTPTAPPPALIAHYTFDGDALDSSGNGEHGTLVNGATFTTGKKGDAVDLDGRDDYVALPSGIVAGLEDFTVATWVKLDRINDWTRLFDFGMDTDTNMFLTPRSGGGGPVRYAITNFGNAYENRVNGSGALPRSSWKHVAITKTENVATLYVDGVQVGQSRYMALHPGSMGDTLNNWIGRSQYDDPYLDGQIDEFRIYNYGLSASEVQSLFQNP